MHYKPNHRSFKSFSFNNHHESCNRWFFCYRWQNKQTENLMGVSYRRPWISAIWCWVYVATLEVKSRMEEYWWSSYHLVKGHCPWFEFGSSFVCRWHGLIKVTRTDPQSQGLPRLHADETRSIPQKGPRLMQDRRHQHPGREKGGKKERATGSLIHRTKRNH